MEESDWPAVSALIAAEWESDHPVLNKDFFFWQHRGFGKSAGVGSTSLAFASDRLVGMRGVIPGIYQLPRIGGGYKYVSGGSFAMWIVERESRGTGIGNALLKHCEDHLEVMVALGSNEATSVPIYLKNGFSRQDGLHHWFIVLDSKGKRLVYGAGFEPKMARELNFTGHGDLRAIDNPEIAADIWLKFSRRYRVLGLHRNVDFWQWRYFDHPTFNYRVLVDEGLTTLAVTRTETVVVDGCEISVLRIIELFSSAGDANHQSEVRGAAEFLQRLLKEASESGISAVDYRNSSNFLGASLSLVGFEYREMEGVSDPMMGFAGQLNPLVLGPKPINLHWKINSGNTHEIEMLYFVKSDNDMDRPNTRGLRSPNLG